MANTTRKAILGILGILGSACERVERSWTEDEPGSRGCGDSGATCRWKNTLSPNYYWQCLNYFALRERTRINRSLQRGQPRSGLKSVSASVSLLEDSLIYLCEMHVQRFTRLEVRNCVSQWRFELFNDSLLFNVTSCAGFQCPLHTDLVPFTSFWCPCRRLFLSNCRRSSLSHRRWSLSGSCPSGWTAEWSPSPSGCCTCSSCPAGVY